MSPNPVAPRFHAKPSMGRKHKLPPRLRQKGKAFYYDYGGKPRRWEPLGSDEAKALRKWADIEAGPGELSVGSLVQRYIDREQRPKGTSKQYKSFHRAIDKAFPIPANQLTSQHVALWRETQRHRKTFINGCIAVLCSAFRLGHELGLCSVITVGRWSVGKRDRVLEPSEFRAIRSHATPWLQIAMDLGYLTAARPCDIRALRWDKVSPESVLMRQKKTGQRMCVTMNDDLASVLEGAKQRTILGLYVVATDKGQPVTKNQMEDAWIAARVAAGITDAQFRDIRAMSAKAAKEDGLDFQALLGHATRRMSERYLRGRQTIKAEPVRKKL